MNSIDNEQLLLLKMVYSKVEYITDGYFYCVQENKDEALIINRDGTVLDKIKCPHKSVELYKPFIVEHTNMHKSTIHSYRYNKHKEITSGRIIGNATNYIFVKRNLGRIGRHYYDDTDVEVLDEELNTIGILDDILKIFSYNYTKSGVWLTYRNYRGTNKAFINSINNKIEIYEIVKAYDDLELVAVEMTDDGYSINKNTSDNYRYKLLNDGDICGIRAYQDIRKSNNPEDKFLYTYDKYNNQRSIGLIDYNGNEILSPVYLNINHVGSNNFRIEYIDNDGNNKAFIYNIETHKSSLAYDSKDIMIHSTLPITTINKNGQVIVLDSLGNLFELKDLSKYFKCSYSKSHPDIIKIEFGFGFKYITNKLVPINNLHYIASISKDEWIKM